MIDQHEPETTISSSPLDPTNSTTASFGVTSSDQPFIERIECRIDAGAWSSCAQPSAGTDPWTRTYTSLTDGSHTFEARTVDRAGQIDPTPGQLHLGGRHRPAGRDVQRHARRVDPGHRGALRVLLRRDRLDLQVQARLAVPSRPVGPTSDLENLSEGAHAFSVFTTDAAGNDSPVATYNWNVDLTAPETTVDDGPDAITNENEATFTFSSSQANSTFECKLDTDAVYAPCESGDTFTGIADGDRTFSVWPPTRRATPTRRRPRTRGTSTTPRRSLSSPTSRTTRRRTATRASRSRPTTRTRRSSASSTPAAGTTAPRRSPTPAWPTESTSSRSAPPIRATTSAT